MSEHYKQILERKLWNIADTLRGKMGADEFRDYILGFIFYKYLAEKQMIYADKILLNDGIKYMDLLETKTADPEEYKEYLEDIQAESIKNLGYFLRPDELFTVLAQKGSLPEGEDNFILEDLVKILHNIGDSARDTESEDDFIDLFEGLDLEAAKLGRTDKDKNKLIAKVLYHLDEIDFKIGDTNSDVLGDAYEYLISKFASGAGKNAGEFYTPAEVSQILAKIVTTEKTRLRNVYDPTCGSGSLLLRVAKEVDNVKETTFYGQEQNRTTYNLARMNMILRGVHYRNFDIKQEDTLERPQHENKKFEAIVANPPFSAKWSANSVRFDTDERFSPYGKLAPKSKADYAFITHMIHHLDEDGTMAVVAPHGVLFRGAAEGKIRQYLIEKANFLDAVIGLPANIFYGTSIPTCIMVFKRCRRHPDDVIFIDASADFDKVKTQNVLSADHIDRIITAYRTRKTEDKFSYLASRDEIAENDYNLNIPRYVDTFEPEPRVDIAAVANRLKALDTEMAETDQTILKFCKELGIDTPF